MRYGQTRRQAVKAIGTLAVGTSLAGCGNTGGDSTGNDSTGGDSDGDDSNDGDVEETIEMTDDLEFEPAKLNVDAGETVAWKNVGSVTHTVTAFGDRIPPDATYFASGGAESEQAAREGYPPKGAIKGGESYEHTFETTGTYEYFSIPHEDERMTGTIDVLDLSGPNPHPPEGPSGSIDKP